MRPTPRIEERGDTLPTTRYGCFFEVMRLNWGEDVKASTVTRKTIHNLSSELQRVPPRIAAIALIPDTK